MEEKFEWNDIIHTLLIEVEIDEKTDFNWNEDNKDE